MYIIENELKKKIKLNIENLIIMDNYRGFRHKNGLPVRGQRSRTNGMTQKRLSNRKIINKKKKIKKIIKGKNQVGKKNIKKK